MTAKLLAAESEEDQHRYVRNLVAVGMCRNERKCNESKGYSRSEGEETWNWGMDGSVDVGMQRNDQE